MIVALAGRRIDAPDEEKKAVSFAEGKAGSE